MRHQLCVVLCVLNVATSAGAQSEPAPKPPYQHPWVRVAIDGNNIIWANGSELLRCPANVVPPNATCTPFTDASKK